VGIVVYFSVLPKPSQGIMDLGPLTRDRLDDQPLPDGGQTTANFDLPVAKTARGSTRC
jgi:hypothetical protein